MIVQPESTTRADRRRRLVRDAAIVAPIALLVAVVGAAVIGSSLPSGPSASLALASPGDPADPEEAFDGSPRPAPSWVPATAPSFPAEAMGLPVLAVPEAQARLDVAGSRPVAVAGWLGELREPLGCPLSYGDTRGVLSPLCERRARLVVADPDAPNPSSHLHVTVPPGVALPPPFEHRDAASTAVLPVVLIGRASPPGAGCLESARGCREQLTVDAVAWAGGEPADRGPVWDANLLEPPTDVAYRRLPAARALATRGTGAVLLEAILRPSTVAAVDVEAGAALARLPPPEELVWYVRSLDPDATIRWALLDEKRGRRLATGVAGDPARTVLATPVPRDVAGLPVRAVGEVAEDLEGRNPPRIQAVEGYLLAWEPSSTCARLVEGLPADGCSLQAVLALEPWSILGQDGTEPPGVHVHALVPPGVAIPAAGDEPPPLPEVVVVLRTATSADCARIPDCPALVVERVAWAEGRWPADGPLTAAPWAVPPGDPIAEDPGGSLGSSLLLRAVLLDPGQLRLIDRDAARAVRALGEPDGPLWYLRGLDVPDPRTGGGSPGIRWEVRRIQTGALVASGEAP